MDLKKQFKTDRAGVEEYMGLKFITCISNSIFLYISYHMMRDENM